MIYILFKIKLCQSSCVFYNVAYNDLKYFTKVRSINLSNFFGIQDSELQYMKDVHTIDLRVKK